MCGTQTYTLSIYSYDTTELENRNTYASDMFRVGDPTDSEVEAAIWIDYTVDSDSDGDNELWFYVETEDMILNGYYELEFDLYFDDGDSTDNNWTITSAIELNDFCSNIEFYWNDESLSTDY